MTRWALIAMVSCVLVAGCDDDGPTSPTNLPLVFSAVLSPASEVPPVVGAETSGRGAVQVTFDVTRDAANTITAATATFVLQMAGFPEGTRTIGAHIHSAPEGVAGPVVIDSGILLGGAPTFGQAATELRLGPVSVTPAIMQAIINNPAAFYFNIHSPANPGGFARGQLTRVQ